MANPERGNIERAFDRLRNELGIRTEFSDDVMREAGRFAERDVGGDPGRVDRTELPFLTVDPPGSRDLDQAVYAERRDDGYRFHYAIADVGFFVDRGSDVEREAWRRGVTFYAPDERMPLYPTVLSEGGASLLPEVTRPAILFTFDLDDRAELIEARIERALVRSRVQLTYAQLRDHVLADAAETRGMPWSETLTLIGEFGPKRLELEAERGGITLPIRGQHVQQRAAARLGYELAYEEPNEAENWNAQISLLTGHVAALRMLEAGVGLLRTCPPPRRSEVDKFRRIARGLGFSWRDGASFGEFMHGLDPAHPHIDALAWQALEVMRGAGYTPFEDGPPKHPIHAPLAWEYAHCTAPLRRLADRYVLDLLIQLESGEQPRGSKRDALFAIAPVMEEADRKTHRYERSIVDIAEACTLEGREGDRFGALVIDVDDGQIEVQINEPPIRTQVSRDGAAESLDLADDVEVRLQRVDIEEGRVYFEVAG